MFNYYLLLDTSRSKPMYKRLQRRNNPVLLTLSLVLLLIAGSTTLIYASSDAYDSGYDHGCDDAKISDSSERYYNQPEKGPSFHTDAFNRGYNDGFNTCSSGNSGTTGSSDDRDTGDNEQTGSTNGGYSQGYENGRADARQDYIDGKDYDASCSFSHSDSYCLGFKAGYAIGWGAAALLH
jgi:hypothetical protein